VVPATVLIIGLTVLAGVVVVAPLTGPTVWAGASSVQAVATIGRLIRDRLLQAAVLVGGLSLATGLVGAAASAMVLLGGRVMAEASVFVLGVDIPPEALMAGLLGRTVQITQGAVVPAKALSYISAATVGGGMVFALALVMPTLVYLRGVCEVYLALRASDADAVAGLADPAADVQTLARACGGRDGPAHAQSRQPVPLRWRPQWRHALCRMLRALPRRALAPAGARPGIAHAFALQRVRARPARLPDGDLAP